MIEYYEDENGLIILHRWWELWEINFYQSQIKWLLPFLKELKDGRYPKQPTGYAGCEVRMRSAGAARFTRPVEIAAELEVRLEQCQIDGLLTLNHYTHGMSIIELTHYVNQDETEVWNRIGRCIRFCSGSKRKTDYRKFVNHK